MITNFDVESEQTTTNKLWLLIPHQASEGLKTAKAGLHSALSEYKVLQRPGHAARAEFYLWLRGTENFITMLDALERSWNAANATETKA